jgi:hypothetical protein
LRRQATGAPTSSVKPGGYIVCRRYEQEIIKRLIGSGNTRLFEIRIFFMPT